MEGYTITYDYLPGCTNCSLFKGSHFQYGTNGNVFLLKLDESLQKEIIGFYFDNDMSVSVGKKAQ